MVCAIRLKQACLHSPQYERKIHSQAWPIPYHNETRPPFTNVKRSGPLLLHTSLSWLNFALSQSGSLGTYDNDGSIVISNPHYNISTNVIVVFVVNDLLSSDSFSLGREHIFGFFTVVRFKGAGCSQTPIHRVLYLLKTGSKSEYVLTSE